MRFHLIFLIYLSKCAILLKLLYHVLDYHDVLVTKVGVYTANVSSPVDLNVSVSYWNMMETKTLSYGQRTLSKSVAWSFRNYVQTNQFPFQFEKPLTMHHRSPVLVAT